MGRLADQLRRASLLSPPLFLWMGLVASSLGSVGCDKDEIDAAPVPVVIGSSQHRCVPSFPNT